MANYFKSEKKFDGKKYSIVDTKKTKDEADKRAEYLRNHGYLVRIIKTVKGYDLYWN